MPVPTSPPGRSEAPAPAGKAIRPLSSLPLPLPQSVRSLPCPHLLPSLLRLLPSVRALFFFWPLTVSHNRCAGPSVSPLSPLARLAAPLLPALGDWLLFSALSPAEGGAHPVTDARWRRAIRLPPCVQCLCLSFDSSSSVGTQGHSGCPTNYTFPLLGHQHPSRNTCFFNIREQCKIRTTAARWSLFFMWDGSWRAVRKKSKTATKKRKTLVSH